VNKENSILKTRHKTFAYLRGSDIGQETQMSKNEILQFASARDFGEVRFFEDSVSDVKSWKERKIKKIIDELGEGDRLIVPELSRLGRSMLEIMEILAAAKEKGIALYDVKNALELNGNIQAKVMAMVFNIAAGIERDLISKRTIRGLKAARAKGKLLGRPKGTGKSKLDQYREEIIVLLKNGSTQVHIAKKYGTTQPNLFNWLRKHNLEDIKPVY